VAFRDLYHTDRNVVITAPTGAGKTVMFELAFLNMLNSSHDGIVSSKVITAVRANSDPSSLFRLSI
jgi:ATP-dependent DNA helicase HFM1/MER3